MKLMTETQFRTLVATVTVPEGFTAEFSIAPGWEKDTPSTLVYTLSKVEDVELEFCQNGAGHTRFKVGKSWHSFDRTGVEDSFYLTDWDGKPEDLNAVLAKQFERIEKTRTYYKTAIAIPGIPFSTSPEGLIDLKKRLDKLGSITFTPSGFGTGYLVSKRPGRDKKRAAKATEFFFGIAPLYISTMDCD